DIFAQIEKHKIANGKPNGIIENRVMLPESVIRDKGQEYRYPPDRFQPDWVQRYMRDSVTVDRYKQQPPPLPT
ncbi:MAG: hypothetical protein EZS28_019427, partial [Streblomastix strix]